MWTGKPDKIADYVHVFHVGEKQFVRAKPLAAELAWKLGSQIVIFQIFFGVESNLAIVANIRDGILKGRGRQRR